ncbi:hypothetical protein MTO96_025108 [Rhipicephalus appendiculatus]
MPSKWRTCRAVRKDYDAMLSELGLAQFVAGPRSDSLRSDGAFAGAARVPPMVPPLPPPEPVSRRRLASQASIDNAGEPTSKRFNTGLESEDDRICEQDAALVERDEESGEVVPLCMQSGSECSSSDEDSPLGCESRDDYVTSDSRTGPDEGVALTCSTTLSVEPAEVPASEEFAVIAGKHNMTHACINGVLDFCRRRGIVDLP